MKMQEKYKRTLDYLLRDNLKFFSIDFKQATIDLGLPKSTIYRHITKFIKAGDITLVFKGGKQPTRLERDIIKDAGGSQFDFLSSLYCIVKCSQLEKDKAILMHTLGWSSGCLEHYLWWSKADTLEYDECYHGLSKMTRQRLSQFVKYMIHNNFDFDDIVEMNKFETLQKQYWERFICA